MTAEEQAYETKTVRAVRGTEGRTVAKWEKDGWEVVSQSAGVVRSEILLRRPKPKTPVMVPIVVGLVIVAIVAAVVVGALTEQDPPEALAEASATPTLSAGGAPASEAAPSATPAATEASSANDDQLAEPTITADNSADFAAILTLSDYCDDSIPAFAAEFHGQAIEFDGNIGAINNHGDYSTRYDILIGAGDHSETSQLGPFFQFRDVNLVSDLHYVGDVPDTIGVGNNLRVTAEIGAYEADSCLFLLEPMETSFR